MKFCVIVHASRMNDSIEESKFYVLPPETDKYVALVKALTKFIGKEAYLNTIDDWGFVAVTEAYEYKARVVDAVEDGHFIR